MQAFITGVSTGIGLATAEKLISEGCVVVGTVRDPKQGEEIKKKLGENFQFLILDVRYFDEVEKLPHQLADLGIKSLSLLVNNSGIAVAAPFLLQNFAEIEEHFRVNVLGLMKVTQVLLPMLGAIENFNSAPGKIINISSVAGKLGTPFLAAYVASKHAVEGFSQSLRRELLPFGIDVVVIGPGSVKTPIWQKGFSTIGDKYTKSSYASSFGTFTSIADHESKNGLEVTEISNLIWRIANGESLKTRYTLVPSLFTGWIMPRVLSDRLVDKYVSKLLKLSPIKTKGSPR